MSRNVPKDRLEAALGAPVDRVRFLSSGNNAELFRVDMADGSRLVAKVGQPGADLETEAFMLRFLAGTGAIPVPDVVHEEPGLLVMTFIDSDGVLDRQAETDAARRIAALHGTTAATYGFERDTLIGPLHQPNPETGDWITFFREHRLLHMARAALDEGEIDAAMMRRIEALAGRLESLIGEPGPPSLLHGDLWGGNVMAGPGRINGFIDPAIYYGDAEIELAFSTLFRTFGDPFFEAYHALRPIRDGFFEVRRDLYNLYPLLVHVRLFGGGYRTSVHSVLDKLEGC